MQEDIVTIISKILKIQDPFTKGNSSGNMIKFLHFTKRKLEFFPSDSKRLYHIYVFLDNLILMI